ncbi:MAG: hypothetical protein NT166_22585 [Candidatus Aminicenantes bacterium]|nr:hypothetical protein [Candidatus Aminicenantes bacterium]
MEKKILIIRSVSFQQLDKNLIRIKETFPEPDTMFYLLTHSHGIERAQKYRLLSEIIDYQSRKDFSFFRLPKRLKKEKFYAVIVPVTNKTGAGFLNVFAMALRIKTEKIYRCTTGSDIRQTPRKEIVSRLLKATFFSAIAFILTLGALVMLPFLILGALFLRKSHRDDAQTPCF